MSKINRALVLSIILLPSIVQAQFDFKKNTSFEARKAQSQRVLQQNPDRVPVIIERATGSSLAKIDKSKYLVPRDLIMGQFMHVIRKHVKLTEKQAIFVFVNNSLPPMSAVFSTIYENFKDEDGFLYITYSGENVFGCDSQE